MVPMEDVSFKALITWGEKVDRVTAGSFSSFISFTISSVTLFPSCLLFLHLLLGDAIPPMAWRAKPSTQVEGIWHSVQFLRVASLQEPPEAIDYFGSTSLSGARLGECGLECSIGTGRRLIGATDAMQRGVQSCHTFFLFWWLRGSRIKMYHEAYISLL